MEFDGVKIFDTRKHQADGGEIQEFLSHFDIVTYFSVMNIMQLMFSQWYFELVFLI